MRIKSPKTVLTALILLVGSAFLLVTLSSAFAVSAPQGVPTSVLIEGPDCARRLVPVTDATSAALAPSLGASQTISVRVPAVAIVVLNVSNQVIAAKTNTLCAPRALDVFYVEEPNGDLTPVVSVPAPDGGWVGNFQHIAEYQAQIVTN